MRTGPKGALKVCLVNVLFQIYCQAKPNTRLLMTLRILFCIVCKPVAFQKHNARVPLIILDEHEDRIGGAWRCHGHHRLLYLQVRQDL